MRTIRTTFKTYEAVIRRMITVVLAAMLLGNVQAQVKGQDYTVDKNGDVVLSQIVEGLALEQNEIRAAGQHYLENAYKETKYKIVINSEENGTVAGEGEFLQFHEDNYFPYSYFLNAPFLLRIDAKDKRARVSVVLSYYTGKRSNINETKDIHDRISQFQPVKEDEMEHRKLYGKAFPVLYKKARKVLDEVVEVLKAARPVSNDNDW